MTRTTIARLLYYGPACALLLTAGCSQGPSYDVMGSLFPAWLVCILLGTLLAVVGRWLLLRARISVVFPVLVYPCMAALFTFAIWLFFFQ